MRDKLHPAGGGKTPLSDVSAVVDAKTTIHIKGCDMGRTLAVVELIDEAFGGAGVVTAPTHEQVYSTDPTLAAQARKTEQDAGYRHLRSDPAAAVARADARR